MPYLVLSHCFYLPDYPTILDMTTLNANLLRGARACNLNQNLRQYRRKLILGASEANVQRVAN
jgi:hypothetical protein